MELNIILFLSVVFQILTFIFALVLVLRIKGSSIWSLIIIAIFLMIIRRLTGYFEIFEGDDFTLIQESIALIISISLFAGTYLLINKYKGLLLQNESLINENSIFRKLINTHSNIVIIYDENLEVLKSNVYNISKHNRKKINFNEMILSIADKENATIIKDAANYVINHGKKNSFSIKLKDGTYEIEIHPIQGFYSSKTIYILYARDISDIKEHYFDLNSTKDTLIKLIDSNPNLIYAKNRKGRILLSNKAFAEFYNIPVNEITGMLHQDIGIDRNEIITKNKFEKQVIDFNENKIIPEECYTNYNGNIKWMKTVRVPFEFKNKKSCLVIATDISDRKNMEKILLISEKKYKNIFAHSPFGIFHSTYDGKFVEVNPALVRLLGYDSSVELIETVNKSSIKDALYVHKDKRVEIVEDIKNFGEWKIYKNQYYKKDGSIITALLHIRSVSGEESPIFDLEGIIEDITERNEMEIALRESENKFRKYIELSPTAIFITNKLGFYTYVNQSACDMLGYKKNELESMHIKEISYNKYVDTGAESWRRLNKEGYVHTNIQLKKKNGNVVDVVLDAVELDDSSYMGFCTDISYLKRIENALLESEAYLGSIIKSAPIGIGVLKDNLIEQVNDKFLEITGYSKSEVLNKEISKFYFESDDFKKLNYKINGLDDIGNSISNEIKWIRKNNLVIDINLNISLLNKTEKKYTFSLLDITHTKKARESLINSLKEKEVLIKEVHHRVKNNLQMISSLLDLQINKLDNSEVINNLLESRNRIKSISYVHESLYRSESLSDVNVKKYIKIIIKSLINSYDLSNRQIIIKDDIQEFNMIINKALPLSLILNELISNSIKYSTVNNYCEIDLIIRKNNGNINILLKDNGPGLKYGFTPSKYNSLGLSLIDMLTKQIHGKIHYHYEGGSIFEITLINVGEK